MSQATDYVLELDDTPVAMRTRPASARTNIDEIRY